MKPIDLVQETPVQLVRRFQRIKRSSRRSPLDLLTVASQLLHQALTGLLNNRGCTRVPFLFEGFRTHAHVEVVTIMDREGEFILEMDRILKWKPDDEVRLGELLETAVEAYLDSLLPQWREGEGADGNLVLSITVDPDGALVIVPRGHATVRTMIETEVAFPALK